MYNKLVRDKIIDKIKNNGETPIFRKLSEKEYNSELNKKILEEVNEYIKSEETEELADLVEVIYAILELKNVDMNEFEKIRLNKKEKRGGFEERIFLEDVR